MGQNVDRLRIFIQAYQKRVSARNPVSMPQGLIKKTKRVVSARSRAGNISLVI